MRTQPPKIIIKFEPSPTFQEEFLEFLEEILKFEENKEEKKRVNNCPFRNTTLFKNKMIIKQVRNNRSII